MLNILQITQNSENTQIHSEAVKYAFKVQTELPLHLRDRSPLDEVGLVRVSAAVGGTGQI